MSTFNRLDLESLGSLPTLLKNFPGTGPEAAFPLLCGSEPWPGPALPCLQPGGVVVAREACGPLMRPGRSHGLDWVYAWGHGVLQ
jgi:hypothetical protein